MKKRELVDAYLNGRIDRRRFVRGLVAGGVTATAAVTYADVLAAGASGPLPRNVPLSLYPTPGGTVDGVPVLIGRVNTADAGGGQGGPTVVKATTGASGGAYPDRVPALWGQQLADPAVGTPGQFGVLGSATGEGGIGVVASSDNGASLALTDSGVAIPPLGGGLTSFWDTGAFVVTGGQLWFCWASGIGANSQWVNLSLGSRLVTLPAPVRVYDSRIAGGALVANEDRQINATANSSGVPASASAILVNLAIANTVGTGFLGLFKDGISYPGNANINWFGSGQVLSNAATTAVANSAKFRVHCGIGSTHVIVDVIGYYP